MATSASDLENEELPRGEKNVIKIFRNNYDNYNNDPDQVKVDLSKINIFPEVKKDTGKKCKPG